jgi:hypothetical protein
MDTKLRTPSGPSQKAYDKFGAKPGTKGIKVGTFPVFDPKSGEDAIKLRGHAPDPSAVLDKVQAWAQSHKDRILLMKVRIARSVDAKTTHDAA